MCNQQQLVNVDGYIITMEIQELLKEFLLWYTDNAELY